MARTLVKGPLAFTAANNTELETYDSSFVEVTAGGAGFIEIQSNKLTHTFGANFVFVYRDGTPTYSADQYAKAALAFAGTLQNVRYGVAVRVSGDTGAGQDWYAVTVDDNTSPRTTRVYKCVNGSTSTLDSRTSVTWTNGDTIELEAVTNGANCDLLVYKNGTLQYTITDSSSPLSSGKPGLYGYDNAGGGAATLDDWEGGDVTGAVAPVLTTPTGDATGKDAGTAGATTDTGSGTMYGLPRIGGSQASGPTIVSTGVSLAISSSGAKTIPLPGLTTGSTYVVDICHNSAGGNSNVVTSPSFTPSTLAYSGTIAAQAGVIGSAFSFSGSNPSTLFSGGIGSKTITENTSLLAGRGLSVNGSTGVITGTPTGAAGTISVSLKQTDTSTAGTEVPQVEVSNTFDIVFTVSGGGPGTLNLTGIKQWTGAVRSSITIPFVKVFRLSTAALVHEATSLAVDGSGNAVISHASITAGVDYMVFGFNVDGSLSLKKKVTAS